MTTDDINVKIIIILYKSKTEYSLTFSIQNINCLYKLTVNDNKQYRNYFDIFKREYIPDMTSLQEEDFFCINILRNDAEVLKLIQQKFKYYDVYNFFKLENKGYVNFNEL